MIGQKNNLDIIQQWRINKSIPRFIIISGEEGSGRLTLSKVIIKTINATGIIRGNSIDDVRTTIENAYTLSQPIFYIFRNADDMSQSAKNALLKVVEEPPNNAYFIMTVRNIDNILSTIKSRATHIKIEPYTLEQLRAINDNGILLKYCITPGQLQTDEKVIIQAEKCVNDIMSALLEKSGTRVLKSCTQLKSKATDTDKIDCLMFMQVFKRNLYRFSDLSLSTLSYFFDCEKQISRNTVNKKYAIECMLINMLEDLKNAKVSEEMG